MFRPHALLPYLLVAGVLLAPAPQNVQPLVREPVRLVDDGAAVELELDDVALRDLLDAVQPILGLPLQAEPADVYGIRIGVRVTQRVERDRFREALDELLLRYGFWTCDVDSGGSTTILVFKPLMSRPGQVKLPFTPPVVTIEELTAGPARRCPMYTTTFQVIHAQARDLLTTTMSMFDAHVETLRYVEGSNQLLITASREHLLTFRDALEQMDIPGPRPSAWEVQLESIGKRLADLEQRLTALETTKAGG